ncbi:VOC family protein [Kribbella sp. NPDC051718]|uniref:VOC family protein n=1 Tax=Kribbella sp. NPDC051718 TaxID=3155168 RepID=UPI003444631A
MTKPSASASVEVATDPATAFRIFTAEIDLWWVRGPINFFDATRAIGMQIEPGLGGRILEIYRHADATTAEDVLELGQITAWDPGALFAYRSSVDDTETEIRFAPVEGGTRVSVEQTLLPGGKKAFYFWPNVIGWYADRISSAAAQAPAELDRLGIALYYEDPAAAAEWLGKVFGLESSLRLSGDDNHPSWNELRVGGSAIMLFALKELVDRRPVDHAVWISVDDLDAHFARSTANGAVIVAGIEQHGYRSYEVKDLEGHHWRFVQSGPSMA